MTLADTARLVAGMLLVLMGAAVLLRRRRDAPAVAFGVFAIGLGGLYLVRTMGAAEDDAFGLAANVVVLVGYWSMFLVFPTRISRDQWSLVAIAFATGFLVSAPEFLPPLLAALVGGGAGATAGAAFALVASAGIVAGVVLFPLRARRLGLEEVASTRSLAIFAVGVALFRGYDLDDVVLAARGDVPLATVLHPALSLTIPALLWVVVASRGAHARLARDTTLAHVGIVIASLLLASLGAGAAALQLAGALLLGFAILRGQIEGLDLKVRFAISRSTIAAAFVAAFFIASEGAQLLFGQGNEWVGLLGAGALVFALAPVQRAAERLAEKAVPAADAPTDPGPASKGEDAYRRAVRLARKDRALTPEEEVHLFHVAEALGVPAGRAMELRHEVEREARPREAGA